MSFISIRFWAKDSGSLMSHKDGLTKEQIEELQRLKEGDRLICWRNNREHDKDAHYTLKKYQPTKDRS